jgi:aspartate/methionine/tyrosine aminotransferase
MNYQEYRNFRNSYLESNSALRLDCMNPVRSLAFLVKHETRTTDEKSCAVTQAKDALHTWAALAGVRELSHPVAKASGVRALLKAVFAAEAASGTKTVLLPNDVYPVYWALAQEAGLKTQGFATCPALDLEFLNHESSTLLLLTNPLMPAGRFLSMKETDKVLEWLKANPRRRVILDGVYHFSDCLHTTSQKLISTGRAYFLHSLSKSWLLPEAFGVALLPEGVQIGSLADNVDELAEAAALQRFAAHPDLPSRMQKIFDKQWKTLTPLIQEVAPRWEPPETGYFSTLEIDFETLLRSHGIMSVPATVFDSKAKDVTAITCLYYGLEGPQKGAR